MKAQQLFPAFLIVGGLCQSLHAQGDTLWTRTYGSDVSEFGQSVQQTAEGGFVIVGIIDPHGLVRDDIYLIRTDANGDTLWTRTYGGSGFDTGSSVQQTADSGFVVVGSTDSFGAGSYDVYLIRTDANGDTLWTRTYGGSDFELGSSVQQTADGGFMVAGRTGSFGAGSFDVYLIRTDANGDTLWTRTIGTSSLEAAHSLQMTTDGGFVIAGIKFPAGARYSDVYLIRTDANGDTLWPRTYGGSISDISYSVKQTTDSGFIVAGYTNSFGAGEFDVYLIRTDVNGDALWARTYGGSDDDRGFSVLQTASGGFAVAGYTHSFAVSNFTSDVWLIQTDANGDTLWTRTYGGSGSEIGFSVQQTADGGFVVAGRTSSFGAGSFDVYLIRVAAYNPPEAFALVVPENASTLVITNDNVNTDTLTFLWAESADADKDTVSYGLQLTGGLTILPNFSSHVDTLYNLAYVEIFNFMIEEEASTATGTWQIFATSGGDTTWASNGPFTLTIDISTLKVFEQTLLSKNFALDANYPNPFNPSTTLTYNLPLAGQLVLVVYDLRGLEVARLVDGRREAGYHQVTWAGMDATGRQVPTGIYIARLVTPEYTKSIKMALLK